jgi:uncharacterized protein YuzE
MKFTYDKEADAAYIYFEFPLKKGVIKKTKELSENIIADYDAKNKLVGVEILSASKMMNKKAFAAKSI